jgi:dTMP kinase
LPALAAGSIVLCDRYTDSSEAYQGGGRELGSERVLAMHAAVCSNLKPDLTVLLLPPLAESLARARSRNARNVQSEGSDENRFEREGDVFYTRVHEAYLNIAEREPHRVAIIGNKEGRDHSIEVIELLIRELVTGRVPELCAA